MKKELTLKFAFSDHIKEEDKNLIEEKFKYGQEVKFTTNKVQTEEDKREGGVKKIKKIKIIYQNNEKSKEGISILTGDLQCDFQNPYGARFFCRNFIKFEPKEMEEFNNKPGARIFFYDEKVNYRLTNNFDIKSFMKDLTKHPNFEFQLKQFDEFLDVFEFYKEISNELNNSATFKIKSTSKPFNFISIEESEVKNIEMKDSVFDENGILIGYKIEERIIEDMLFSKDKKKIQKIVEIRLKNDETNPSENIKKIKKMKDNIFLNNQPKINDRNLKNLIQFYLLKIFIDKNKEVVLWGEIYSDEDEYLFQFLHLYDMGSKIKVESIDNSLKLLKKGDTTIAMELLEYLIGDKEMPNNYREINDIHKKYIKNLNKEQIEAFLMAVDGSPISLIKGPPGTGKTHVINSIIQYITKELDEKVIISSQTHIAIDNVLDKIMNNYDLIIPRRITNKKNKYDNKELDETLYKIWGKSFEKFNENNITNLELKEKMKKEIKNFKGLEEFKFSEFTNFDEYKVLGATTTTTAIAGKKGFEILDGFDWLIIDEVSKCPITEVLRYLPYVKKIIMVGDDFQLSPLLEFDKDEIKELKSYNEEKFDRLKKIYEESVFSKVMKKAIQSDRMVLLKENFRSLKEILDLYNVFYDNELINKRESIEPKQVVFKEEKYDDKNIFFIEVLNGQEVKDDVSNSRYNLKEIESIAFFLKDLIKNIENPSERTVSVIFPYSAQIKRFVKDYKNLINEAKKIFKSFEYDTIDAFQGKEKDIVLVSTVVTNAYGNFLNDFRRINVAMSRARDKLFIFGNAKTLKNIEMKIKNTDSRKYFKEIINFIEKNGQIMNNKNMEEEYEFTN